MNLNERQNILYQIFEVKLRNLCDKDMLNGVCGRNKNAIAFSLLRVLRYMTLNNLNLIIYF